MTNGLSARWLFSWTARAATLLPVPLSPKMRMDAGVLAARSKTSIDLAHHRRREIKNGFEILRFSFGDLLFQPFDALAHLFEPLQAREHGHELLALKWFFEKVHRAAPHGFDGDFYVALRREHDDGNLRLPLLNFRQHFQAIFTSQIQIQKHGIEFVVFEPVQAELAGVNAFGVMPGFFNQETGRIAKCFVVIND